MQLDEAVDQEDSRVKPANDVLPKHVMAGLDPAISLIALVSA